MHRYGAGTLYFAPFLVINFLLFSHFHMLFRVLPFLSFDIGQKTFRAYNLFNQRFCWFQTFSRRWNVCTSPRRPLLLIVENVEDVQELPNDHHIYYLSNLVESGLNSLPAWSTAARRTYCSIFQDSVEFSDGILFINTVFRLAKCFPNRYLHFQELCCTHFISKLQMTHYLNMKIYYRFFEWLHQFFFGFLCCIPNILLQPSRPVLQGQAS